MCAVWPGTVKNGYLLKLLKLILVISYKRTNLHFQTYKNKSAADYKRRVKK